VRRAGTSLIAVGTAIVVVTFGAAASTKNATTNHRPGAPEGLTVNDDTSPIAVTNDPAFGWLPRDVDNDEVQTGYELTVADERTPKTLIVDTGKVTSDQQSYVRVQGLAAKLEPNRAYEWRVRTWDRAGAEGPYSIPGRFATGLGDHDWTASWIRRPGAEKMPIEDYSRFRKDVTLAASPIVHARVAAAAGQQFELYVNGLRKAHGPSFSYPDQQYYETTDVTLDVKPGEKNSFAFVTWWGQPGQGRPASVPGLIAQITIDHADGTRETVNTDATWRTQPAGITPDHPRNDEGDFVPLADERAEPDGWNRPGFDDATWKAAAVIGPAGTKPFTHLVAARTHIVYDRIAAPKTLTRVGEAYVADFGEVYAATPVVDIAAGAAGRRVTLVAGFQLDPDGHVSRTQGVQDTDMTWLFDERAGPQTLRPFGYLGFRYLEIVGAGETIRRDAVHLDARHAAMPDEHAARFETSNATLNAVWALAQHSALYASQEQFLDTPTREKGPFLGDGFDISQATMAAFGERNLTYQALRDFARSQARYWPDGRVNVVYPNGDGMRDIPDATETYVQWVMQSFVTTGDRDTLAGLYPVVQRIGDYIAKAVDPKTGLVTNLPGGGSDYLYGAVDWPPWMRYGYDMDTTARTMINELAVADYRALATMATVLNRPPAEAETAGARADALTNAIQSKLTRPDGIYIDGLKANGKQSTHASQQANAWALAVGLVPPARVKTVADYVVSLKNAMGVVYFRVLLDALHVAGRDDALVASLTDPTRPGYAQILKRGATYTWESWIAPEVGDSESHGWGATVLAVLQDDILGAETTTPGGADVAIQVPHTSITHASGVIATQRGLIPVSWTRDASGHETVDITIPVNVHASVRVGTETGTLGAGRYTLDSGRPLPQPTAPPSKSSNGNPLLWLVAVVILVLLAGSIVVQAVRRRKSDARAGAGATPE
jgi:alpha-L-rhamnosidase